MLMHRCTSFDQLFYMPLYPTGVILSEHTAKKYVALMDTRVSP